MKYPKRGDAWRDKTKIEILWTSAQIRTLVTTWPDVAAVAKRLGKSKHAVRQQAYRMKLDKREYPKPWTAKDRLYALNSTDTYKNIAAALGRTERSIRNLRYKNRNTKTGLNRRILPTVTTP